MKHFHITFSKLRMQSEQHKQTFFKTIFLNAVICLINFGNVTLEQQIQIYYNHYRCT